MNITSSPSPTDMAGVCVFRVFICVILSLLNYHQCDMLTLSPSVQVNSDCAVGGAGRGVQHLLLQVGLQR